jgi:hypothetical protein
MNSQKTPQTKTQATGNVYKTLLALRNTYQPEDGSGIPKLSESISRAAEWSRDNCFTNLLPQRKNID